MSATKPKIDEKVIIAANFSRILDDDFEEFPADEWDVTETKGFQEELLVKDWDDEHVEEDFIKNLRAELNE